MRIDAHQHFWKFDPVRDAWITEDMAKIRRDFFPQQLAPHLAQHAIDGTMAVQADQSESETLFLLDLAAKTNFIKGVVGWLDLQSSDIGSKLDHFSTFKLLKGLRHVVQCEPDDFLLNKNFCHGISLLSQYDLTYDILIYPHQLPAAIAFVEKFPNQRFVIDHLAKPLIRDGKIKTWQEDLHRLAQFENVYCKISGLVTEADWHSWQYRDLALYIDFAIDSFGIKRVMYGSDWPVCEVAATYGEQLNVYQTYLKSFSADEQAAFFGGNATRFYNLTTS